MRRRRRPTGKERVKRQEKKAATYTHRTVVRLLPGRHTLVNGGCVVAAGDLLKEDKKTMDSGKSTKVLKY